MDTWSCVSYSVSCPASLFRESVVIQVDETSGMPYVAQVTSKKTKEMERIRQGDVVFYLNGVYFMTTSDIDVQRDALQSAMGSDKPFSINLISLMDYISRRVPRIEQIILPTVSADIVLDSFATGMTSCLVSLSSPLFPRIAGSVLLAINEEIVLNKTQESILLLLNSLTPPTVFLIACPYQESPITVAEIREFLTYNGLTTLAKSSYSLMTMPAFASTPNHSQPSQSITQPSHSLSSQSITQPSPSLSSHSITQSSPDPLLSQSFRNQPDYTEHPYAVDSFMFPQPQGYAILEQEWVKEDRARAAANEQSWREFLEGIGGVESLNFGWCRQSGNKWSLLAGKEAKQRRHLRALVHEGVPNALRPSVWFHLSGGYELQQRSKNSYEQFWRSQNDPAVCALIERDLPRTFPNHPLFSNAVVVSNPLPHSPRPLYEEEPPFVSSLRRVLLAVSVVREDIQYYQGMNLLAGWLLIVMMDEEKAFWTLAALLQYSFPEQYFDTTLSGVRVDEFVLEGMVRECFPQFVARIEQVDSQILSLSVGWFINLFINALPAVTVARVWDVLILEGDKVIMRVAMALFALNEERLLHIEDDSAFAAAVKVMGLLQFNGNELMSAAFAKRNLLLGKRFVFPYKREDIREMRRKKREELDSQVVSPKETLRAIDSDEE
ncbi:hypothetical protein WA577_003405, partial [Blastocystis sp. JDR]